jgi:hypothetical protein
MIAFSCTGCGKIYKGPETLAGETIRCKQCRLLLRVPAPPAKAPRPRTPTQTQSQTETEVYALEGASPADDLDGRSRGPSPSRPRAPGFAPFEPGEDVDLLKVEECSDELFVLGMSPGWTILRVVLGAGAMVLGIVLFALMIRTLNQGPADRPVRLHVLVVMIPFLLFTFGAMNASLLLKLGYRIAFDAPGRGFTLRRCYGWEETWPAEDLGGIVYVAHKTDQSNTPVCEAIIVDRDGTALGAFGVLGRRTHKAGAALQLGRAVIHAATLIGRPAYVDVRGEVAPAVGKAVRLIEMSEPYRWGRGLPRVNYPFWSHKTIMMAITGIVIAGMALFFLLLFLPQLRR